MVSLKSVEQQLKNIRFNSHSWGRAEISELPNILLDDEKVFECVNGMYEGGFALLCATNLRLLLIDKKPMKFLTVEDLRFDMINQIDYSHRLMGARINVSAGNKNLKFTSYNQQRLRKLINHIQHRMAEIKTQQTSSAENQQQHLERINQQLQAYLLAQHQHQEELRKQLEVANAAGKPAPAVEAIRPAPELADFLYAQSLMQQHEASTGVLISQPAPSIVNEPPAIPSPMLANSFAQMAVAESVPAQAIVPPVEPVRSDNIGKDDLIEAGRLEIFGARARAVVKPLQTPLAHLNMEVNPLKVAYSKLPDALKKRKYNIEMPKLKSQKTEAALPNGTQIAGA